MIWGKRSFSSADFSPYQDKIAKLMLDNPTLYKQFVMVSTKTADRAISVVYAGVPNEALFVGFDGFERVQEADLPKVIDALLVADGTTDEFKSRFAFAHDQR
jgi:hypothetical protein